MKFSQQHKWRLMRTYIIGWTLAFIFLVIIRGVGTVEKGSVDFELGSGLVVSLIFGLIFGTISGLAQTIYESKIYKKVSFKRLLLTRLIYTLLFLGVIIVISYFMVTVLFDVRISFSEFLIEPGSFPIYFYIMSVDVGLSLLRQITLLLGYENLWKLMRGKFYTPSEEMRFFMFVDLQAATTHAERLGHIKYSQLIQDCFNDLGVVIENEAEIYQYVGDEAVLTWELPVGIRNDNCLQAYFNFQEQLKKNDAYYQRRYQCSPFFKAGLHGGKVTVTEVGRYKKEIAFHGDVINTASRIQGLCNSLSQSFLISSFVKEMCGNEDFIFTSLGEHNVKGKHENITLFSVSEQ